MGSFQHHQRPETTAAVRYAARQEEDDEKNERHEDHSGAIALLISWYATTEWQGPHGIGGLRARLANIQALRAQQACLEVTLAQKKKRVDALESGQHVDVEIHRQGFILPGETKYVVPEPSEPEPDVSRHTSRKSDRPDQTDDLCSL